MLPPSGQQEEFWPVDVGREMSVMAQLGSLGRKTSHRHRARRPKRNTIWRSHKLKFLVSHIIVFCMNLWFLIRGNRALKEKI